MVVNGVPVSSILEDHWRKHVHGSVSGGIDLRGGRDGVTHVAGLARLQGGMLTGLPVLDRLALFCGSSRFRNLPLHEASAQFVYQESAWHISNILVESENLVRVEGWLEIGKGGADRKAAGGAAGRRPVESSSGFFRCVFRFPPGKREAIWHGPM